MWLMAAFHWPLTRAPLNPWPATSQWPESSSRSQWSTVEPLLSAQLSEPVKAQTCCCKEWLLCLPPTSPPAFLSFPPLPSSCSCPASLNTSPSHSPSACLRSAFCDAVPPPSPQQSLSLPVRLAQPFLFYHFPSWLACLHFLPPTNSLTIPCTFIICDVHFLTFNSHHLSPPGAFYVSAFFHLTPPRRKPKEKKKVWPLHPNSFQL